METGRAKKAGRLKAAVSVLVPAFGISVGIAAFAISVLVTYDVVTRTLFGVSNSWVTEICTYLMAYMTFGGAAYAMREGAHVKVDLLVVTLPRKAARVVNLVADAVMLVVVALLVWLSFEFIRDVWDSGEKSPSLLAVPLWIPYVLFFLGMVWLVIEVLTGIVAVIQGRELRREPH